MSKNDLLVTYSPYIFNEINKTYIEIFNILANINKFYNEITMIIYNKIIDNCNNLNSISNSISNSIPYNLISRNNNSKNNRNNNGNNNSYNIFLIQINKFLNKLMSELNSSSTVSKNNSCNNSQMSTLILINLRDCFSKLETFKDKDIYDKKFNIIIDKEMTNNQNNFGTEAAKLTKNNNNITHMGLINGHLRAIYYGLRYFFYKILHDNSENLT